MFVICNTNLYHSYFVFQISLNAIKPLNNITFLPAFNRRQYLIKLIEREKLQSFSLSALHLSAVTFFFLSTYNPRRSLTAFPCWVN